MRKGVASPERKDVVPRGTTPGIRMLRKAAAGILAGRRSGARWGIGIAAGVLPMIGPVIAGGTLAAIAASRRLGASAAAWPEP